MADYSQLVQALAAEQSRLQQQNPWIQGGNALAGANVTSQNADWQDNLMAQALAGFLGGASTGFGQNQVNGDIASMANAFSSHLSSPDPASAMLADPSTARLAPYFQLQERANQDTAQQQMAQMLMQGTLKDGRVVKQLGDAALQRAGVQKPQSDTPIGAPNPSGLSFPGVTPLRSRTDERAQQLQTELGLDAKSAMIQARAEMKAELEATGDSFDQAKKARERAETLNGIANQAESAIANVGYTGWGGQARQTLANVAGFASGSQAQKASAGQFLEQLNAELIGLARVPGSGATSDFEAKQYLKSGPSLSNTPEANRLIIDKMKNLATINADYADFLDAYRRDSGTTDGADALWRQYTKQYPIFKQGQGGSVEVNERPSWRQFFSQESTPGTPGQLGAADVVGSGVSQPQPRGSQALPPPMPGESKEAYRARVKGG